MKLKLTQKFDEMSGLARVAESVKMLFVQDILITEYTDLMRYYLHTHKHEDVESNPRIKLDMRSIERKLIELQRLFAKYNMEDSIRGLEFVAEDSEEYFEHIEPFKYEYAKNKKDVVFKLFFHESVAQ